MSGVAHDPGLCNTSASATGLQWRRFRATVSGNSPALRNISSNRSAFVLHPGPLRGVDIAHQLHGWWTMRPLASICVVFAIVLAGCMPMPSVALQATPADLEMLAGEWSGEYESAGLGRLGRIEFKLKAGTDEAYGDVLMVPRGRRTPYEPHPYNEAQNPPSMPSSEMLRISFIRASNGTITGRLDRYWDPDRSCYANTAFSGNIGDGRVDGAFRTTFECGTGEATGTWTVSRKPARRSAAWD